MKNILTLLLLFFVAITLAGVMDAQQSYNFGNLNVDGTPVMPGGGSVPSGFIGFIVSGACPAGYTEVAALNGVTIIGTVAANMDVGGTGGANDITPTVASLSAAAQTVNSLTAAAQTVNSLTAAAQVFSGTPFTDVINHTHVANVTDGGHFHTERMNTSITGATGAGFPALADASTSGGPSNTWVTTTTNTTGITVATVNPAGGVASITPAGTNGTSAVTGTMNSSAVTGTMNSSAVTGTLNQFDNRSAYVKVIGCAKN